MYEVDDQLLRASYAGLRERFPKATRIKVSEEVAYGDSYITSDPPREFHTFLVVVEFPGGVSLDALSVADTLDEAVKRACDEVDRKLVGLRNTLEKLRYSMAAVDGEPANVG